MAESYVFKVTEVDSESWRTIQASGKHRLEDLSGAILEAFEFDDDHLFAFFMDGEVMSEKEAYWSGREPDNPSAESAHLAQFHFVEGDTFLYLFDFGDEWLFRVTVEKVLMEDTLVPIVLGGQGEAPEQYSDYDDDDEYDEDDE